ncbi:MAG: hypothetical protein JRJ49_03160 [Deltaproteobacteria bacterium]|nr:hypothetical protein [Deltaproteobacteria bacterium]
MINKEQWRTATIADIFAEQGYLNYSETIYKNLLKKEPNNIRFKKGYEKLLDKIKSYNSDFSGSPEPSKEIVSLFRDWVTLVLKSKKLKELNKFKSSYKT